VEIQDAVGNLAAFSNLASGSVALAIENNPSSGTLSGTTPVSAVDGIATFSGMSINNFGLEYTLKATVSSLSGISAGFDILNMYGGGSGDGGARLLGPIVTLSGQVFWIGGLGTNPTAWNDPLNWRPNTNVPGSSDRLAMEPNNNGHNPILDQDRTIQSINFNGSNKKVELGNNNLTINGELLGTNSDNYFKTNGTGLLIKNIPTSESFQFPVGNTNYNPVTITNNNASSDEFSVKVRDEVLVKGTSGSQVTDPHVNATWDINKTNTNTGSGIDLTFQWESTQEANSISSFALNHYNSSTSDWQIAIGTSATPSGITTKTMTHTDYTGTFSPFAIGDGITPLPIDIISFNAKPNNNVVDLTWTSYSENTNPFNILKSNDGVNWIMIGTLHPNDNNVQYLFTDHKPASINYYQLSQLDQNNVLQYSDIRVVNFNDNTLTVFPNPNNGDFTIQSKRIVQFQICDYTGKVVLVGDNSTPLIKTNLIKGIYFIKISEGDKTTVNKIIVQ
jgi:hypothetical protein